MSSELQNRRDADLWVPGLTPELAPELALHDPVGRLIDWTEKNDFRLSQVQGFSYGADRLLLTIRDCWLVENQVIWQKRTTPDRVDLDHAEMMRAIEIYRMELALSAIGLKLLITENFSPGTSD